MHVSECYILMIMNTYQPTDLDVLKLDINWTMLCHYL